MTRIRIGARGSDLSLAQTRWLLERFREARPGVETEIVIIETTGDRDQQTRLGVLWPPGGFVKEIERALLDGQIDAAVHSLKDVPTDMPEGLVIAAIPVRESVGDVLLTREPVGVDALPDGFVVGTSSPRREAQMASFAPRVTLKPIRGNVPTRIRKLDEGQHDGIVLAQAGLARLGINHPHRCELPVERFLPSPGQGALAAQAREGSEAAALLSVIDDESTRAAVTAERTFLAAIGGGCHAPVGALGTVDGDRLTLRTWVYDSGRSVDAEDSAPVAGANAMARRLAEETKARLGPASE